MSRLHLMLLYISIDYIPLSLFSGLQTVKRFQYNRVVKAQKSPNIAQDGRKVLFARRKPSEQTARWNNEAR